jgi:hypothetical protein
MLLTLSKNGEAVAAGIALRQELIQLDQSRIDGLDGLFSLLCENCRKISAVALCVHNRIYAQFPNCSAGNDKRQPEVTTVIAMRLRRECGLALSGICSNQERNARKYA